MRFIMQFVDGFSLVVKAQIKTNQPWINGKEFSSLIKLIKRFDLQPIQRSLGLFTKCS